MAFPLPQYIQLYPTIRCNQACTFCFNSASGFVKDMSPDNALNLLDSMLDLGIADLDIMGGEPFLLPWMPSFIHAAIEEGIMVNVSTNGSLPEVMEEFRGLSPEKINIGISLEGSSAQTHNRLTCSNHFEKAVTSITKLVSLGLNPIVKTVVNRQTLADMTNILALLRGLGVRRYYLIHMDLLSKANNSQFSALSYPAFLDSFRKISAMESSDMKIYRVHASCFEKQTLPEGVRCAGGVRKLSVMPDGSVYPCNLFQHFPEFRLGNIFADDFTDIWMNRKLDYFRHVAGNNCRITECSNFISCTGCCPAHGYFHYLDLNGSDIRCLSRL